MGLKLAVGVLASKAPAVLERTLLHWDDGNCAVYVHVDSKFDLSSFSYLKDYPFVTLVPERVSVFWGGFTMVEAEIALMQRAHADGFDYFLLQSDDAVPMQMPTHIGATLRNAENWMSVGSTQDAEIRKRYDKFYCLDVPVSHPLINRWDFSAGDFSTIIEMKALVASGKTPLETLFWSSQWKCLSFADVDFMLHAHKMQGWLRQSFRFSMIPDEHYIATILARRPEGFHCLKRMIWTDFSRNPRPYIFQEMSDLDSPRQEGYLFARKVHDPELASRLIETIHAA